MKAVVCTKYGSPEVLRLQDVEKPVIKRDEVLVRIRATTVARGDAILRNLPTYPNIALRVVMRLVVGWKRPRKKVLGVEFSGEIESTGEGVTRFKKGDHVYGASGFRFGCYAEYIALPETKALAIKPSNVSFEEAAAVPVGATTALHYLRKGDLEENQRALIYGASGSVGTFAVQLAKEWGAEVTGVCSTANLDLVRSLGADKVIDYTKEDFSQSGETYDLIFDAVGKASPSRSRRALKKGGILLSAAKGFARDSSEDLVYFRKLIEAGKMKPAIDRRYTLEQIVEAHAYVDKGHKRGNVVVTVGHSDG